jgi:hypothetical protein
MAYNALTGTVIANRDKVFSPSANGGEHSNAIHGEFHGDGLFLKNVARVVANDINDYLVTLGNQEQSLVGEPNLRFNGTRLYVNAPVTASALHLTDLPDLDNPDQTVLLAIDENGNVFKSSPTPTGGPLHSIQFEGNDNAVTGSSNFIFNPVSSSLFVSGAISGSTMQLNGLVHSSNPENTTLIAIDENGNLFKSTPAPSTGPIYSLQFEGDSNSVTGSSKLTYNPNLNQVALSGNLIISGNITAHTFDIVHTDIVEIDSSGSTNFGNSNDDVHVRTGSLSIMSSSGEQFGVDVQNKITSINTGIVLNRITTATNYTIEKSNYIIGVDSTSNPVTITLPDANSLSSGHAFIVKDEGGAAFANNITITASGSQKINSSNTAVLQVPYSSIQLYCNGTSGFFIF